MYEWHNNILKEQGGSVITSLREGGIVSIDKTAWGFRFVESCDSYYGGTLTREQFIKFIRELEQLLED